MQVLFVKEIFHRHQFGSFPNWEIYHFRKYFPQCNRICQKLTNHVGLNTKSYRDTLLHIGMCPNFLIFSRDVPKLDEHLRGTIIQLSVTGNYFLSCSF